MKFKLAKDVTPFKAYGYTFGQEPVDVIEESLIIKFQKYDTLEVVKTEKKAPAKKKKAGRPKKTDD